MLVLKFQATGGGSSLSSFSGCGGGGGDGKGGIKVVFPVLQHAQNIRCGI